MIESMGLNPDNFPPEIQEMMRDASKKSEVAARASIKVVEAMAEHSKRKLMLEESIAEHELDNAINPITHIMHGWTPAVVPFEIKGGVNDGKRIVALCVKLADGKTVLPVLQVPDFDMLAKAQYIGSKDDLEIIIPPDQEGVGWQKEVGDMVEEYNKIYGGDHE